MTRVAVTVPYFDFVPEVKAELLAAYPDAKLPPKRGRLSEDELIEHLRGCEAAVIGLDRFTDRVCAALPDLKVVSLCSAGVDHIDPAILNKYGIRMWWAAGINKVSVAELTVSFMISALRRVHELSAILYRGEWKGPVNFGNDLRGKTVGIHGCGHIGKEVVRLLANWGVRLIACDRVDLSEFCAQSGVEQVSFDRLLAESDVLTIHLSRNSTTIGLYTDEVLARMKRGAVLINCARGNIVDEVALKARLESGQLGGGAFDVFAQEPANGNPLLAVENFFATPHIGASTSESLAAMLRSGIHGVTHAYRQEPGVYPFD